MSDELILETRGLTKEFKGFTAVDGVDLQVRRGHIHALIGPTGTGFHFWKGLTALRQLDARVLALLELVDLREMADVKAADLPYGRKRALEIATTMAMEPVLMLLDEPTQGMGHEDVERVTALI